MNVNVTNVFVMYIRLELCDRHIESSPHLYNTLSSKTESLGH
jgi:hypothetical protein